jgi:hypothetical protein
MMSLAVTACLVGSAVAGELGTVHVERLGPYEPTPAPSPKVEERIRIIESLTMQNRPDGVSVISFQAADYVEVENGNHRTIAIEQYSFIDPKDEARALRDEIIRKLRALEKDLLEYVEIVGPPRAPQQISESLGGGQRP